MPTYAVLGATGSTGSSILRCLLSRLDKNLTLNVFVRSRSNLLEAFPIFESTKDYNTNIIEGLPSDATAMQECLKHVDVIMACIGSNYSSPGMTLIYDTATAIIDALNFHQEAEGSAYKVPTIIQLRSGSLSESYVANNSWIIHKFIYFCLYHIYEDLNRACELFTATAGQSPRLLNYIFIDPPSIHDAKGTTPTGYELILNGKQSPMLSYADLGAAFCEVATRRDEFYGEAVGVTATGHVNHTYRALIGYILTGASTRFWQ